jgi:hypothetical protein
MNRSVTSAGGTAAQVSLWTRTGTYVGAEYSSIGRLLLGTITATIAGTNLETLVNFAVLSLGAGLHGFYVDYVNYRTDGRLREMLYTDGSNTYSNSDLSISTGIGKGNPAFTGSTFLNRTWNGTLRYQPTVVVPEPSTVALLASGLAAMIVVARRRRA